MSYILDALRKADAERDRGNVPGIHAQPSFGGAMPTRAQPAAKPWLWLAAGALAVAVVAALAWYVMSPSPQVVVATPTAIVATPQASPPIAATPTPIAPVPVTAPPRQPAAPKPDPAAIARKPKPAPSPEPVAAAGDAKPAATGEKIYTLAELPPDIRRQLPALSIGGSRFSSKAADRILIINGQVLHEGDPVAPDLVLRQIRSKAALLDFKGYRYSVAF